MRKCLHKYWIMPTKSVFVLIVCTVIIGKLLVSNYKPHVNFDFSASLSRAKGDQEEPTVEPSKVKFNNGTEPGLGSIFVLPVKKTAEWMISQELLYAQRKERIRQACQRYKIKIGQHLTLKTAKNFSSYPFIDEDPPIERPNHLHAFLLRSSSVMACNQPKVASTSVVLSFLLAEDSTEDRAILIQKRDSHPLLPRSEAEFKSANETYFKFMFVRHPIDRLLSAYLGKVFDIGVNTREYFVKAKNIAQAIMASRSVKANAFETKSARRRRQIENEKNLENGVASGAQILDHWESLKMKYKVKYSLKKNMTIAPTFEEFLEFILSTSLQGFSIMEGHWTPYWRRCSPCHIPYDVIGKTETSKDDFTYIWQRTGLDERIPIPWLNKKGPLTQDSDPSQYYAALPRNLILRVYQRFRLDFEMFDYSINDTLLQAGYAPLKSSENVEYSH